MEVKTQTDPVFAALTVAETAHTAFRMEERRLGALDLPDAEAGQKIKPFSAAVDAADEELLRTDAMTTAGFAAKAHYLTSNTFMGADLIVDECVKEFGPMSTEAILAAIGRDAGAMVESGETSKPEAVNDRVRHLVFDLEPPLSEAEGTHGVIMTVADYGTPDNLAALQPIIVTLGEQLGKIRAAFDALHEASGGAS